MAGKALEMVPFGRAKPFTKIGIAFCCNGNKKGIDCQQPMFYSFMQKAKPFEHKGNDH